MGNTTDVEASKIGKTIETDVLILGAGAAGCMAAIGAREQGARVTVVDKGVIESCGCAGAGNDHYMAHLNTGPEWDSDGAMTKLYSHPKLLLGSSRVVEKTFIKELGPMIKRLEDIGMEFFKDPESGEYHRTGRSFGLPGTLMLMMKNGKYLKRKLAAKVRQVGTDVVDRVMVTKILQDKGKVAGAVGFNIRTGEFYIFRAKKVVVACGKAVVRPWSNNSTGNPFNTWFSPYNNGSHQVLAYEAGAKVVNLELAFATILPKGFGAPGMNALTGMGGYQLNSLGERYMEKYHRLAEGAPRGVQVISSYKEQSEGKGPPFYIDVRHLPEKEMEHLVKNLLPVDKDTYVEYLEQRGMDLRKDLLETEVGELAGGGRLLIDERCQSTLSGLFGSGVGEGLSGALAGGLVAGTEAAKDALEVERLPEINADIVVKEKERIFAPLGRDSGYTPKEYEDMIRQIMNYYAGYVRNQRGLELALNKLEKIGQHIDEIRAGNYHELLRANEARHLLKYCQLMVRAALERKESGRGLYMRSDYPNLDKEEWTKIIALWEENGRPRISFEPLD